MMQDRIWGSGKERGGIPLEVVATSNFEVVCVVLIRKLARVLQVSPSPLQLLPFLVFFGSVLVHLEPVGLGENTAQLKYLLEVPTIKNQLVHVQTKCVGGGEFGGFHSRVALLEEDTLKVLVDRLAQVDDMDPAG